VNPLTQSLAALKLDPAAPVVLMIGRGRLMLRTSLPEAEISTLQGWLRFFEVAMREARRRSPDPARRPSPMLFDNDPF